MDAAVLSISQARTLLLMGQGLLEDPTRRATTAGTLAQIRRLGYVQLDSINTVERAHHHILWTRRHAYRPALLDRLQRGGRIFEHWTHDASIVPSDWFPHWRPRFSRVESWAWSKWLHEKLGRHRDEVLSHVLERVRGEGPLMARDFEHEGRKSGPWWDWKPAKAALEYWWRRGDLAIPRREGFQKVYDLTERVLPHVHSLPPPTPEEHLDWACKAATDRLGVATPRQIAAFFGAVSATDAAWWCTKGVRRGGLEPVRVEGAPAFATADWRRRLAAAPDPPGGLRFLSPFDPILRDRARCERLFGFEYRFEAFVPEAKRRYGYYILPILERDRLVGRLDPALDRRAGTLTVRAIWWEPGIRATRARRKALDESLNLYAEFNGARATLDP